MELVYISRAIRRYWWLAAACVVLGLIAGFVVSPGRDRVYETEAWIQISSPFQSFGATATDRDVQNHLVVLESDGLAQQVAESIEGVSADDARRATTFEQVPGSDIIRVISIIGDAEDAQAIANGYVDEFIELTRTQRDEGRAPDLDAIESNIATLEEELGRVNARIDEVLRPYIQRAEVDGTGVFPTVDQVAPGLGAEREAIRAQYTELVRIRTDLLVSSAQSELGTRAVQRAPLPEAARDQGISLLMLAMPFGGLVLGGLLSVALARISPRILDTQEITEALGVPIAATIPRHRAPATIDELLADPMPSALAPSVHELCVRAEAAGEVDAPLVVMVTGSEHAAGATTLAVAMASHFADAGARVLLVDVDADHPQLSDTVAERRSGVTRILAGELGLTGSGDDRRQRDESSTGADRGVTFAGLGSAGRRHHLQRSEVRELVERARGQAQVVVFDAGMLMDAASSVELARLADAVVLCVPHKRQRSHMLSVVGRQLAGIGGDLLPVLTPTSVRRAKVAGPAAERHDTPATVDGEPDRLIDAVEPVEPVESLEPVEPVDTTSGKPKPSSRQGGEVKASTRASRGSRGSASRSPAR